MTMTIEELKQQASRADKAFAEEYKRLMELNELRDSVTLDPIEVDRAKKDKGSELNRLRSIAHGAIAAYRRAKKR